MEEKKQKKISIGWALLFLLVGAGIAAALFFFLGGRSGSEVLAMFQGPTVTPTAKPTGSELVYEFIEEAILDPKYQLPETSMLRVYHGSLDFETDGNKLTIMLTSSSITRADFTSLSADLIASAAFVSQNNSLNLDEIRVVYHDGNFSRSFFVIGSDAISKIGYGTTLAGDVMTFETGE